MVLLVSQNVNVRQTVSPTVLSFPGQTGSSFLHKFSGEIAYQISMKLDMYTYEEGMQAFAKY